MVFSPLLKFLVIIIQLLLVYTCDVFFLSYFYVLYYYFGTKCTSLYVTDSYDICKEYFNSDPKYESFF